MSEIGERYRKVAGEFTARVRGVPDDRWDNPAPCEGWVARDVVGHLVEWLPAFFFERWGIADPHRPSAQDDPVGAWTVVDSVIQRALDDHTTATAERDTPMGTKTFADMIDAICTGDVLIHTWDLARATGLDEHLDPAEVRRLLEEMEPMDDVLRQSSHFGPRVAVPDDADEQTKLLAFVGRHP